MTACILNREAAYVSTWPTKGGLSSIDPFSIYGPVKWLSKKPAKAFLDDQFAIVKKGVNDGLLEMEISVSEDVCLFRIDVHTCI